MKIKRFRAYAEKEDLLNVFQDFQGKLDIVYVPAYSDTGRFAYKSIMDIENLGVNFHGSHQGNMQMLIFLKTTECLWRSYQCRGSNGQDIIRYSALGAGNIAFICVDFNGIYHENAILPTEISTMNYEDATAKQLYDGLKKVFRKQAVKTLNGYYICPKAYEHKEQYRFCTIDVKSPPEYDLLVE